MTVNDNNLQTSRRGSSSPTPSNATAPLLVSEDLHSLSNSSSDEGGTTSDWSSPSSIQDNVSDAEEEEAEDDEGFDLLASQELRQLPSDSSKSNNSCTTPAAAAEERMSLSFPDPINTTTTAASLPTTDDSEDEVVTKKITSRARARSPLRKVRQDVDDSILIDEGGYSLLLDAPPTSSSLDSVKNTSQLEQEETTSTPPPPPPQFSSSRPGFSKSPSSSIIRVSKRANSNNVAAGEKIDKWRSTLNLCPSSSSRSSYNTPSPVPSSSIKAHLTTRDNDIIGDSIDLSSVNSSQTVVPLSTTPLARSLLSTPLKLVKETISPSPELEIEKTSFDKKVTEEVNHSRKALDRISDSEMYQLGSRDKVWWNRLMVGLTVLGVVLAGVGSIRVWRNQDLATRSQFEQQKKTTCSRLIPPIEIANDGETDSSSLVSVKVESDSTASPTNSAFDDSNSLSSSSSSVASPSETLPLTTSTSTPSIATTTMASPSSLPLRIDPPSSSSIYRIDPPFSLISPLSFDRPTSLKEKMLNHAMRCRAQQSLTQSSLILERLKVIEEGGGGGIGKVSKRGIRRIRKKIEKRLYSLQQEEEGNEYRRRTRKRKPRTILNIQPYSTSSFEGCKAEETEVAGTIGVDLEGFMKGTFNFFGGLEKKIEKEVKSLVHHAQQSLESSSALLIPHEKLSRYRSEKYPIVRDYYRSKKEQIKSTIGKEGETIRQAKKGIKRVQAFDYKGKTQAMVSRMKDQARLMRMRGGIEIERAQLGKKWREVFKRGEKHVKRAARAVKKIEKKDYWQSKREERRERRERRRREQGKNRG
ncbi:hypothetical protein JCM5350_006192 [Sporobolomyces pararoseus]